MAIARIRTILTGWPGGAGLHTTYWRNTGVPTAAEINDAGSRVRAFWVAIAGLFPTSFSAQVSAAVDIIDEADGALLTAGTISPAPAAVVGTTGTLYGPYATMALLTGETGQVRARRRVRGRSYLGPLGDPALGNGQLSAASATTIAAAAAGLLATTPTLVKPRVWVRPQVGTPGAEFAVNGYTVPLKLAVLRSRRD